jgi:methionyl-tRNA formyltransferase
MPVRAVLVGAVESSLVVLERIAEAAGWTLALVVTLPPEKSGRHSDFVDLHPSANAAGCELLHVSNINSEDALAAIEEAKPDYVFVAGWSQICGPEFMAACRGRVIGYHPAPLPRLRGRAVIPWTILNREPITAGTLFWIDQGVDSGPILAQEFFHVASDETAATLYRKHMEVLGRLTATALEALKSPNPPRIGQDERFATWAARRTRADGVIDWASSASDIERLVRAVGGPYPPASTNEGEHSIEIKAARVAGEGARFIASCGQVVASSRSEFSVKCGDGMILTITEWSHSEERCPKMHSTLGGAPAKPLISVTRPALEATACRCGREYSDA